jgi:hypothetical protein
MSREFSGSRFFEWLEELRPTWYTAAPAIHREILEAATHKPGIAVPEIIRPIACS